MKKAIIFDIDGTIMPQGAPFAYMPSERLKKAIKRLQEKYFIAFASGRAKRHVLHLIDFLELSNEHVISAGSEIIDGTSKEISWSQPLTESARRHVLSVVEDLPVSYTTPQVTEKEDEFSHEEVAQHLNDETTVLYAIGLTDDQADKLVNDLAHDDIATINMHHYKSYDLRDVHIHSNNASKFHAVSELLRRNGIAKEDTIVIGDGDNDIELFKAGGVSVAMGNASQKLKDKADVIIGDVAEDGLATYLESLL